MAYIGYLLRQDRLPLLEISELKLLNFTFTMQLYGVGISSLALLFSFVYDKDSFRNFFRFRLNTKEDHQSTWRTSGPIVAIAFTLGITMMMSLNVVANKGTINGAFFRLLPLVFLFAATNAWTEEIISRFVVVAGAFGKIPPTTICLLSGAIFGAAHIYGTPGGLFGMVATGILGWLLARSVIETKSLGWALLIHFLLDMVIFGAGAMVVAGSK